MKFNRLFITISIAILSILALATVASAQKYCTIWQDIYFNNQGILGENPNVVEPGVLIYVVDRCGSQSGSGSAGSVYDHGPSPYAQGRVSGNVYHTARGDTWYSVGVRFGLPWRDIFCANGGGSPSAGRQLRIPGLSMGPSQPLPPRSPTIKPAVEILSPSRGAPLPTQFTVSGSGQGLHEGNVHVRALDRAGNLLAQSSAAAQGHDVSIGGRGTWAVQLVVNVPPGTRGKIVVVGTGVSVQDCVSVTYGGTPPSAINPSISIMTPPVFSVLPPRFTVSGSGQGIGWNDIIVQAVANNGVVLSVVRTKLQGYDVAASGEGIWSAPLDVIVPPGTPGKIRVMGEVTGANLSRDVTFGGQNGYSYPNQSNSLITRFTVDQQRINPSECVTFYWNTRNASTVYFYRDAGTRV